MKKVLSKLLHILFPSRCPLCQQILTSEGCPCWEKNPLFLPPSWQEQKELPIFSGKCTTVRAAVWYKGKGKEAIWQLKFRHRPDFASGMGNMMARLVPPFTFDLVTFVPMTGKSRKRRGYNQAQLLAREVASICALPCYSLLEKTGENPSQHTLGRTERLTNAKGLYCAIHLEKINGRRILLIDDVITTGSTIAACAEELRKAGAKEIGCLAFAYTGLADQSSFCDGAASCS